MLLSDFIVIIVDGRIIYLSIIYFFPCFEDDIGMR